MHAWDEQRTRQVADAIAAMQKRAADLTGKSREIAVLLTKDLKSSPGMCDVYEHSESIMRILWTPETTQLADIFQPDSTAYTALAAVAGDDNARIARAMWDNSPRYPYQVWYCRRSCRSQQHSEAYMPDALLRLRSFLSAVADGFTLDNYLDERGKGEKAHRYLDESRYVPQVMAVLLDRGDAASDALLARLREIVTDEAGNATLTRDIIAGLLKSERDEAIDLVRDLLRAARLSEGLRQAILEEMDMGSPKAFLGLLKLLIDENMARFSSVSRAFFVWIGIYYDLPLAKKCKTGLETAFRCLTDADSCRASLADANPLNVIIALWAVSFRGIEHAEPEVKALLQSAPRHVKLAALCFISQLELYSLQFALIRPCLDDPACTGDKELLAWVLRCLEDRYGRGIAYSAEASESASAWRFVHNKRIGLTRDELTAYYSSLKAILDSLGARKKGHDFTDSVLPGISISCSPGKIAALMAGMLGRKTVSEEEPGLSRNMETKDEDTPLGRCAAQWGIPLPHSYKNNRPRKALSDGLDAAYIPHQGKNTALRDDLCSYWELMDAQTRAELLRNVIYQGFTPVQRGVLISLLADRDGETRSVAWRLAMDTPFSDEELRTVEGFLRFKDGKIRQPVFLKLLFDLGDRPEKLAELIERLNSDKDAMKRKGGEELLSLLARRKDEPQYAAIRARFSPGSASGPAASAPVSGKAARQAELYTSANGFGLYDPALPPVSFPLPQAPDRLNIATLFGMGDDPAEPLRRAREFYRRVNAVIAENRLLCYRVKDIYGEEHELVLGEEKPLEPVTPPERGRQYAPLSSYPLADTWQAIRDDLDLTAPFLYFANNAYMLNAARSRDKKDDWLPLFPGGGAFAQFGHEIYTIGDKEKLDYADKAHKLVYVMAHESPWQECYDAQRAFTVWLLRHGPLVAEQYEQYYRSFIHEQLNLQSELIWGGGAAIEYTKFLMLLTLQTGNTCLPTTSQSAAHTPALQMNSTGNAGASAQMNLPTRTAWVWSPGRT